MRGGCWTSGHCLEQVTGMGRMVEADQPAAEMPSRACGGLLVPYPQPNLALIPKVGLQAHKDFMNLPDYHSTKCHNKLHFISTQIHTDRVLLSWKRLKPQVLPYNSRHGYKFH